MFRHRITTLALFLCILAAVPAAAQEAGIRAGVSVDPDQFYFGGHVETKPFFETVTFRPNVEIGIGNDLTLFAFNFEFVYHVPTSRPWNIYAGGGPALNVIHFDGETESEGGLNFLVGVQHDSGLFAEFKVGLMDSPDVKFGVGYAFKWR